MKNYAGLFSVASTGKKMSNVDSRQSLRFLSANNRMKVSDNLKRLVGIQDHVSYGVAPIYDEESKKVLIGLFASVGVDGENGVEYPNSSKISKTNEFTDANICSTTRKLVADTGVEIKDKHLVFLPLKDEDTDEIISFEAEAYGEKIKVFVFGFEETEDKQRGSSDED